MVMPAVTNLGYRPTFDEGRNLVAEAHLLDFDGDLYGRTVDLDFLALLRGEQKFESPEALGEQIRKDVAEAECWIAAHPGSASPRACFSR